MDRLLFIAFSSIICRRKFMCLLSSHHPYSKERDKEWPKELYLKGPRDDLYASYEGEHALVAIRTGCSSISIMINSIKKEKKIILPPYFLYHVIVWEDHKCPSLFAECELANMIFLVLSQLQIGLCIMFLTSVEESCERKTEFGTWNLYVNVWY